MQCFRRKTQDKDSCTVSILSVFCPCMSIAKKKMRGCVDSGAASEAGQNGRCVKSEVDGCLCLCVLSSGNTRTITTAPRAEYGGLDLSVCFVTVVFVIWPRREFHQSSLAGRMDRVRDWRIALQRPALVWPPPSSSSPPPSYGKGLCRRSA